MAGRDPQIGRYTKLNKRICFDLFWRMRERGGRTESQAMKYCREWECPCIHFLYLMWVWINSCGCDDVGAQVAQDEWRLKEWPTKLPTSCNTWKTSNKSVLQVKAGCRTFHSCSMMNCHCCFFFFSSLSLLLFFNHFLELQTSFTDCIWLYNWG